MLKACLINRFKQCTAVGIVGSVGVYVYACAFVGVNEYARWVYGAGLGFFSWPIQRAHGEEWREGFRRSHTTIQIHVQPHTLQNRGQMVTPFYGCTSRCAPFAKASSLINIKNAFD